MATETAERADRLEAIAWARRLVGLAPLVLDTETTGLSYQDEVIEIAVVDLAGRLVFESLVCPTVRIDVGAQAVHGLSIDDLAEAPRWDAIQQPLLRAIGGRAAVIYNALYYEGRIAASARATGCEPPEIETHDLMEPVSVWCGQWSAYHGSYRFQPLAAALRSLRLPPIAAHRARADANAARLVLLALAAEPLR